MFPFDFLPKQIVCQDSADDATNPGNEMAEQADNDPAREDLRDGDQFEDLPQEDAEDLDHIPRTCSSLKREVLGGNVPLSNSVQINMAEGNGNLPLSLEAPSEYHPDSTEQSPVYPDRGFAHEERCEIGAGQSVHFSCLNGFVLICMSMPLIQFKIWINFSPHPAVSHFLLLAHHL